MTTDQLLKCLTLFNDDPAMLWALAKTHDGGAYETRQRYNDVTCFWERLLNSEPVQFSESYQMKLQHFTSTFCDLLIDQLRRVSVDSNPLLLVACHRVAMSPQTLSQSLTYVKSRVASKAS
jgi:hypothetical protein